MISRFILKAAAAREIPTATAFNLMMDFAAIFCTIYNGE